MLAPLISDHVNQALARMMEQYKGKRNFVAFLTALVQPLQDLENATYSLDEGRQLFNGTTYPAIGAQLDGIGAIVGSSRNGLSDAQYLLFILGTIAENTSDTTLPVILNIIGFLFQPVGLMFQENFPASIGFAFTSTPIDPAFFALCANIIQNALGAGIGLGYIVQYSATNPFAFTDLTGVIPNIPNGNGFDDLLNPGQGGVFADLVYNNPNA